MLAHDSPNCFLQKFTSNFSKEKSPPYIQYTTIFSFVHSIQQYFDIRYFNSSALCLMPVLFTKLIAKDGGNTMREKKEINIQIGEQIKLARENAKLTQEQFAERIEVSPQYVSDLERGVVGLSVATLKRACIALGISADQILFGNAHMDYAAAFSEKCKSLTGMQYGLLLEIVERFVAAIQSERHLGSDQG